MEHGSTRVLIECADASGVVAAVATALAELGVNITEADQHSDTDAGRFFMRTALTPPAGVTTADISAALEPARERFGLRVEVRPHRRARVAILCSHELHCVEDLLFRMSVGEIDATTAVIVSNHEGFRPHAESRGIPFHHVPVTKQTWPQREREMMNIVEDAGVELVVLARFMRILSEDAATALAGRCINIHHSFLPAFAGARPYHQAFHRGVKLIGATAHYVTPDLDQGPIIAQQTTHVSHRDTVADLVRKGRDLERTTLAEAVRLHLADKVLVSGPRTVVFD